MKSSILSLAVLVLMTVFIVACSDSNPKAPDENSYHAPDWVIDHNLSATADLAGCALCHGADFKGSGNAVSCFSCHYDGPPFTIHPSTWTDPSIDHRAFVLANGFSSCALSACHGTSPFVKGGLTAPSCGTDSYTARNGITYGCHTGHISGALWVLPEAHAASAIADLGRCLTCHDMSVSTTIPSCRSCHASTDPLLVLGSCLSCHNNPPDSSAPTFNVRPNRAGHHLLHVIEQGFGCSTCHLGSGSGSQLHWYPDPTAPADVAFQADINLTYTSPTCTGDCHGENHNDKGAW